MKRVAAALMAAAGVSMALGAPGAHAADTCPNAAYRHGAGANLPDCRAWEQATPVDKDGDQFNTEYPAYATPSGDSALFISDGTFNATDGNAYRNQFSSTRGSGWTTGGLGAPLDSLPSTNYIYRPVLGYSEDHTKVLTASLRKLTSDAVEGNSNVYVRDTADRSYTLAATVPGTALYDQLVGLFSYDRPLYGGNSDFSRVAFYSSLQLVPDAPNGGLYLVGGGRLTLVSRDGNGDPTSVAANLATDDYAYSGRVASDDGGRVLFRENASGGLFERVDGTSTVLISHSHRTGDDPSVPVSAVVPRNGSSLSPNGKELTFATVQVTTLTDDGPPSSLYRWSADGDSLRNLLAGVSVPWSSAASSFTLLRVSSDGRYLWFTFLDQDANGQSVPELAVLDTQDKRISIRDSYSGVTPLDGRFSADGTKMLAVTARALTNYDQTNPDCPGGACVEGFLFDAAQPGAAPVCVSCGPAGTRAVASLGLGVPQFFYPFPSVVGDDGSVAFDTPQRLVGGDVNRVSDAYLYTPGRGARLASSGTGQSPAAVAALTPSARDVFFSTADPLVPQDSDDAVDLYDARVDGGLAAQQVGPARGDGTCPTANCPASHTAAPAAQSPSTSTFRGQPAQPAFAVASVSSAARRAAGSTGRLRVSVRVGAAGRVSARATSRLGRRSVTVGRSSASAKRAGRLTLTLSLSRVARRALARDHRLRVALTVSYTRASKPASQSFTLTAPRSGRSTTGGGR